MQHWAPELGIGHQSGVINSVILGAGDNTAPCLPMVPSPGLLPQHRPHQGRQPRSAVTVTTDTREGGGDGPEDSAEDEVPPVPRFRARNYLVSWVNIIIRAANGSSAKFSQSRRRALIRASPG